MEDHMPFVFNSQLDDSDKDKTFDLQKEVQKSKGSLSPIQKAIMEETQPMKKQRNLKEQIEDVASTDNTFGILTFNF